MKAMEEANGFHAAIDLGLEYLEDHHGWKYISRAALLHNCGESVLYAYNMLVMILASIPPTRGNNVNIDE